MGAIPSHQLLLMQSLLLHILLLALLEKLLVPLEQSLALLQLILLPLHGTQPVGLAPRIAAEAEVRNEDHRREETQRDLTRRKSNF